MSHMQEQEGQAKAWQDSYEGYRGDDEYRPGQSREQKLNVDGDEMFADMLIKRMRQESGADDKAREELSKMNIMRMWLGIISVVAVIPIFIAFGVALASGVSGGATIGLGWGFVAACAVLLFTNAYFNWASIEIAKQMYGRKEEKKG
ncbi:hypothetical protein KSD_41380 [Ktedonobacter sp. SOSP1-85]|uniref:hypothetical protein n=1 Tax=Ktedonobacter sp. SOSP1-85 TaxID=2778367 RepID=UPI0019164335|nr:hypothetical protein [Ktedonobacter sp. SOSP1-85]GHO76367.1 hypothetical protein KSD_41380 [Ktedonobacter sp. SOSP1-85]